MEFRLLGSVSVVHDGAVVSIPGGKERLLLVRLLVQANRVVAADSLVDELWPGGQPNAEAALWTLVSRLRHVLDRVAGGRGRLVTRKPGYLFAVSDGEFDVTRFEAGASRGRAELTAGQFARASATLAGALSLWHGPALVEFADASFARVEAARLAELRNGALEDRVDAELALGRHGQVVAELDTLVGEEPLRERRWGQLMLALYRGGRQAEALRAYQTVRTNLAEELGIEPNAELVAVEEAILLQKPELDFKDSEARRRPGLVVAEGGEAGGGVCLPSRLGVGPAVGFVGRAAEGEALAAAMTAAAAGQGGRVILLGGEAGVGKTTLVAAACRAAHAEGVTVLYGRCDEDLAIPYGPFVEVVSHYLDHAPAGWLELHDPRQLGELRRLVPGLPARLADLPAPTATDPDAERWLLFGAVADLLAEAAARAPVVVVVDDLHWADRPTLKLLGHLAARPLGRVLIVGTCRDAELSTVHPLTEALGAWRRDHLVDRLALGGLSAVEVAAFVEAAAGSHLGHAAAGLAHALFQETDGNPFFVAEVLRHLSETGKLAQGSDGRWAAPAELGVAGLPDSVREVVTARVGRLGDETVRMLSTAAVIGQEFDLDLLSRATGADEDRLLDGLGRAERAALVSEAPQRAGRFRFAHGLIQRILYQDLGATRQARGHARVAEALEALCGGDPGERAGELARHFLAAVTRPAQIPKAVNHARRAGERALSGLAPDEALRWYSQALTALGGAPDELERARCLVGLGDAQRQTGDPGFRDTLLEAARLARQLGDTGLLIRAALANNRGFVSVSREVDTERVEILEAALATAGHDTGERARLLATVAVELTYHPDLARRQALADEAVAVARRASDSAGLLDALVRPYTALMVPELADQRLHRVLEAAQLAETVDDPAARFWAFACLGLAMVERGDIDGVHRAHAEIDQIAAAVGQPSLRWVSTWTGSWRALLAGQVDQAERLTAQALQVGNDSGQPDAFAIYGVQLFCIRWYQGRLSEVLPSIVQVAADNPSVPAWQATLAFGQALEGDPARARKLLGAAQAAQFELPADFNRLIGTCIWADVASELADDTAGATLYEQLGPWHDQIPASGATVFPCVAHRLGRLATVLGRDHEADAHFAEALIIHRRLRAPYFIAETELAWGLLLTSGRPDRARPLLVDAAELAARYGYRRVQRLASQALG